MSNPLANKLDLEGLWPGRMPAIPAPTVTALLAAASASLRDEVPGLDDRIESGDLDRTLVVVVVVRMVKDAILQFHRIRSKAIGSTSFTYDVDAMTEWLQPTATEVRRLQPKSSSGRARRPVHQVRTPPVF